jgi:hypothetical protein
MTLEKFYTAIRHKSEPQTLAEANEDLLTYGTRRYLKLFRKENHKPLFISRNIPAIFFSPFWFLYRRMYVLAFIFPLVWFIIEYGVRQYTQNDILVDCLELAFAIYISLFANSFYINNTRKRFAKGLNSTPSSFAIYAGVGGVVMCFVLALMALKIYFTFIDR